MIALKIVSVIMAACAMAIDIWFGGYCFRNREAVKAGMEDRDYYDPSWMDRHKYWEDMMDGQS